LTEAPPQADTPPTNPPGQLPSTGRTSTPLVAGAFILLIAGITLVFAARRRHA
jgi:LPXTG-motif cell wall-anchored protein